MTQDVNMQVKYAETPIVRLGPPYEFIIAFRHTDGYSVAVEVGPQREYERPPTGWVKLNGEPYV